MLLSGISSAEQLRLSQPAIDLTFRPVFTHYARVAQDGVIDVRFTAIDASGATKHTGDPPTPDLHVVRTSPMMIQRPRSPSAFQEARRKSFYDGQSAVLDWDELEILGPNITDKYTLSQLARMSGNAYALPEQSNWWDIDEKWNRSSPVGWEDPDMNGFRGHVFATPDNSTIVLSIKGTTTYGGTAKQDKLNDNLLFSCCCSRSPWIFGTVCDCYSGKSRCDNTCLHEALMDDNLFYSIGLVCTASRFISLIV